MTMLHVMPDTRGRLVGRRRRRQHRALAPSQRDACGSRRAPGRCRARRRRDPRARPLPPPPPRSGLVRIARGPLDPRVVAATRQAVPGVRQPPFAPCPRPVRREGRATEPEAPCPPPSSRASRSTFPSYGLQPVDAVRGVPAVHGRRRGGPAARRQAAALGRRDRRQRNEWDAEITEQHPTSASRGGAPTARKRRRRDLPPLDDDTHAGHAPDGVRPRGLMEKVGDMLGASAPRPGRPRALQGLHRVARHRDRRLARRGSR